MAAIEAPEKIGIRPFDEFSEIEGIWPRGDRLEITRKLPRPRGRRKSGKFLAKNGPGCGEPPADECPKRPRPSARHLLLGSSAGRGSG